VSLAALDLNLLLVLDSVLSERSVVRAARRLHVTPSAVSNALARLRVLSIDGLFASGGLAGTEVDVVLGAGEKGPGVRARPVYQERIELVARAGHPALRGRLTKSRLAALRHVEIQVAPGRGNQRLAASYVEQGIPRSVAVVVPTFTAAAAVVARTDLVASLPSSLVGVLGPRLALRPLATPLPRVVSTINLLWHERTERDPALAAFRELLAEAAGA
jgi:DNA-binding transcriptional LysR family regulator